MQWQLCSLYRARCKTDEGKVIQVEEEVSRRVTGTEMRSVVFHIPSISIDETPEYVSVGAEFGKEIKVEDIKTKVVSLSLGPYGAF